jgi:hypothetical protein
MVGACGTDWINSPVIVSLPIFTHFGRGSNSNLHEKIIFSSLFFSFISDNIGHQEQRIKDTSMRHEQEIMHR